MCHDYKLQEKYPKNAQQKKPARGGWLNEGAFLN